MRRIKTYRNKKKEIEKKKEITVILWCSDVKYPDIECPVIEAGCTDFKYPVIVGLDIKSFTSKSTLKRVWITRNPEIKSSGY